MAGTEQSTEPKKKKKRSFTFPSAVTTLAIVLVVVWFATFFIPAGVYDLDDEGSPIPGTYQEVDSPLSVGDKVEQLVLAPINGIYGLFNIETDFVDTETIGFVFGQIGVIVFIMAIGAFISVSFHTRALDVAVGALAHRLRSRGWLLIASVMVLFSLLGSTMGFSVETLGFYALFLPLMAALGYDRLTTSAMIIVGAYAGIMAATVNPFSIGVAAGEAGVSIGDGILLRVVLWVVITAICVVFVLRYAAKVRKDPSASLVGFDEPDAEEETTADAMVHDVAEHPEAERLTGVQKKVLWITALAFALMIFSVIPWTSLFGSTAGPADYYLDHEAPITGEPLWFDLGWWFPQLSMLFIIASLLVGLVAKMPEGEIVRLIKVGASDMMGPAIVVLLAGGVTVIMNNTQTLDTILSWMEALVSGVNAGVFAVATVVVNIPLAVLIPSSSGHAALAMPLLAPLADFAGVSRATTITAWITGHGLTLLWAPTSVVVVAGLAIAKVGYDKYLRFIWPLVLILFVVSSAIIALAAGLE